MPTLKVIFAAGGTGGHIFPAIAIADEIKKKIADTEILFIGAKGRIEEKIVPQNNYNIKLIEIAGFNREKFWLNATLPMKVIGSVLKSKKIIKEFKPNVVVGTGGFVCGPVVYAANKLNVPVLLQEGNSYPGRTIQFHSKKAEKVILTFEESNKYVKRQDNVMNIAHPIRTSLKLIDKKEALKSFNLPIENKTIFIFGASQGARGINIALDKIALKLYEKNINLIWQTGVPDFKHYSEKYAQYSDKIKILDFIQSIAYAFSAADLVICRSGITSIMEIAYLELPAILIPLPTSAENHQEMNARSMMNKKAAVMLLQKDLDDEMYSTIEKYLYNEELLSELRTNVSKFSDINAASKIADEVIKLAKL
ncbi:MAG: undecaprenyldiphospho-muramoylpentapeptide beta-N-acetylglucosaminyltransferase [Bacteroidetes bacterium]|nr:undecaprenyldiphospho-muramoylpentapeptide beta-N-acetylglucosaminyltransferase [Bacteroidota bacterium]